jgi:deoxyribonuclease V
LGSWPVTAEDLVRAQETLAQLRPPPWEPAEPMLAVSACFVCFASGAPPGGAGEKAWAAAATTHRGLPPVTTLVTGKAPAAYEPGLLALREGALLEAAFLALPEPADVLLVSATGQDHPRRAGLALHLGAVLGIPTIGATRNFRRGF